MSALELANDILETSLNDKEVQDYRINIINALKCMLRLPYYKNKAAESGAVHNEAKHEEALSEVLKSFGFKKGVLPSKIKREDAMKWINEPELAFEIPDGVFIEQPFGTHNSPDFIIKVSEKFTLFLEAKSATGTTPLYNSGGVSQDFLYVFCSKTTNKTTIYKGDSIITLEQQKLIDEHIEEARRRDEELNAKLKELDPNHRGICYYTRPMINQSGGKSYKDYFAHEKRELAEKRAIDWVQECCAL